jgi:hypothetical protein
MAEHHFLLIMAIGLGAAAIAIGAVMALKPDALAQREKKREREG